MIHSNNIISMNTDRTRFRLSAFSMSGTFSITTSQFLPSEETENIVWIAILRIEFRFDFESFRSSDIWNKPYRHSSISAPAVRQRFKPLFIYLFISSPDIDIKKKLQLKNFV